MPVNPNLGEQSPEGIAKIKFMIDEVVRNCSMPVSADAQDAFVRRYAFFANKRVADVKDDPNTSPEKEDAMLSRVAAAHAKIAEALAEFNRRAEVGKDDLMRAGQVMERECHELTIAAALKRSNQSAYEAYKEARSIGPLWVYCQ